MNGLPDHNKPKPYNVPPLSYRLDHEDEILREYHKQIRANLKGLESIKHGFSTKEISLYTVLVSFFWFTVGSMLTHFAKHNSCDIAIVCGTVMTLAAFFWIAKTRKEWKPELE